MPQVIDQAMRFKWRIAFYFFSVFFASFATAISTSGKDTSATQWIIAVCFALGSAFGTVKALFDMNIDTTPPAAQPPALPVPESPLPSDKPTS